jgi:hypothetical protein
LGQVFYQFYTDLGACYLIKLVHLI